MFRSLTIASAAVVALLAVASGAYAQNALDGGVITDSGSTNFRGYHLKVWSDGNALAVMSPESAMRTKQNVGTTLTDKFFDDVKAARANPGTVQQCMKSASFGHTVRVSWHGWTSPDLTCLDGASAPLRALATDVSQITDAAHVTSQGRTPSGVMPRPSDMRQSPGAESSMGPIKTMAPRPSASPNPSPSSHP